MGIKEAVRALSKTEDEIYSIIGKVVGVDESAYTCEVAPLNGDANIQDVRFKAVADDDKGFVQVPVVGSVVVVTFFSKNGGYLGLASELKQISLIVEGVTFRVDKDGLHLSNDQTSFKDQVNALITVVDGVIELLKTFKVLTPSGPSTTVMPDSLAALQLQETALTKVKEAFEKILT